MAKKKATKKTATKKKTKATKKKSRKISKSQLAKLKGGAIVPVGPGPMTRQTRTFRGVTTFGYPQFNIPGNAFRPPSFTFAGGFSGGSSNRSKAGK